MDIPAIRVSDILKQKVMDIQSRIPIRMNIPSDLEVSFSQVLDEVSGSTADPDFAAPIIDPELMVRNISAKTKYPLVSGSYESEYPRLSQAEIAELMPRIDDAISKNAEAFNLDPKLIRAVMKQESSFQPFALSTSGAMGLMQLMPGTADWLNVTDPYNIEQNVRGGSQYLRDQLNAFGGDIELALAAYNAGPNAVKKYGDVPPYQETQNYVKKVQKYYDMYKALGTT